MDNNLRDTLNDMSQFISLEVGDQFTGKYKGFKRVPNNFDSDKETIELWFDVNGNAKSMTSMSLPKFLLEAGVSEGDLVTVKKVSRKGNTIVWSVVKAPQVAGLAGPGASPSAGQTVAAPRPSTMAERVQAGEETEEVKRARLEKEAQENLG